MKTSTVTPSFYVFNISLSCNNSIPSVSGNLWRALLIGNHLKLTKDVYRRIADSMTRFEFSKSVVLRGGLKATLNVTKFEMIKNFFIL